MECSFCLCSYEIDLFVVQCLDFMRRLIFFIFFHIRMTCTFNLIGNVEDIRKIMFNFFSIRFGYACQTYIQMRLKTRTHWRKKRPMEMIRLKSKQNDPDILKTKKCYNSNHLRFLKWLFWYRSTYEIAWYNRWASCEYCGKSIESKFVWLSLWLDYKNVTVFYVDVYSEKIGLKDTFQQNVHICVATNAIVNIFFSHSYIK